tara:strand:- start:256 stop:888 length:633 start_codon:yes stop_codon:yes gene_type:complete
MEQIGWSLVDEAGAEVQYWGDTAGQGAGVPDMIRLPNGDHVHCPAPGQIGPWQLMPRMLDWGASAAPMTVSNGTAIVTRALSDLKTNLNARVDSDAEAVRLRYITPGAGMAMTYAEKRDQANAVHGLGQAAANALTDAERVAQFPTLAASVGLEAATLWDCAQLVIAKSEAWADLSNVIERTRLLGKKSISDASDAATARAAYEAIAWTV